MLSTRFQFRDLLISRGADMINPDLGRAGGITECRRIAWIADVFGALWAPHVSTGSAPYMARVGASRGVVAELRDDGGLQRQQAERPVRERAAEGTARHGPGLCARARASGPRRGLR